MATTTSDTATRFAASRQPTWAPPSERSQIGSDAFNVGLVLALAYCVVFWLLAASTVYWLI